MNLTTTKERLLPPLLRALAATDSRNTLPILSHLLLECEAGRLTVTGSTMWTSKPWRSPRRRSVAMSPARPWPKRKSGPSMIAVIA